MRSHAIALVIVASLVVLFTLAPVGSAAPPPEGVCGVCGSAFERSAEDAGVDVTIVESTLTVEVTADGNSHWTANVTLDRAAADRFATEKTLVTDITEQTYASSRTVVDDPQNLSVVLDEQTLTVTFTVPDVAHQSAGGVLLFDGFVHHPPNGEPYIDADTVTVRGPPGTVVTHAPPGSIATGNQSGWTTATDGQTDSSQLGYGSSIAFAPDNGIVAQGATAGVVRAHALNLLGTELQTYALGPAILLGFVAVGLLLTGDRLSSKINLDRTVTYGLAAGVGLYVAFTAVAFLVGRDGLGFVLSVVGIGLVPQTALTALVVILTDRLGVPVDRNISSIAAVAVFGWALVLILGAPVSAFLVVGFGPLVFLPFGVLAATGHWTRLGFPAVVALSAVVAALPFVPRVGVVFVSPPMLALLLSGSALLGIPLFLIGWRLGSESTSPANTTDSATGTLS